MELSGLDALAELRARDIANGIDPTTTPRVPEPPRPPLAQPFRIPPFDSSSFVEPVRAVEPAAVIEDTTVIPAKARPKSKTPNLDKWNAMQMSSDTP